MGRFLLHTTLAVAVMLGPPAATRATPGDAATSHCDIRGVDRVVAIGDVHGAYDRLVEILRATDLVDAQLRWMGGKTHLVQVGDIDDRGPDSRKVLDLVRRLEGEATASGGHVHVLLGNHEVMRMLGDLRFATPGEFESFAAADSAQARRAFVQRDVPEPSDELVNRTPLGAVEMRVAFGPDGLYGGWLRTLDTVVKINGVLFLHGGISPAVSELSCDAINDTVRQDLTSDFDKTAADPLQSLAAREDGPLWYRGLAQEPDTFAPEVDQILVRQSARAIVIAHTVTATGRIRARFGRRVVQIDTGMQPAYVRGGRASALEIRGDAFTAIYLDRQDALAEATRP
jgi:diadenosine tetraphosphatase ApaH/serine/threonine PP2A family protein phosphatase